LAYKPKGVFETIRKKRFKFMFTRKTEHEGISLVKWRNIANPKEDGD
jgi:hypothetical protein